MIAFRPSLLPKLAACAKYQPEENAGEAAARGTRLDLMFREIITGGPVSDEPTFTEDDVRAVGWAVDTARILAGSHTLEAREAELRIECEGMEGTADLLCEGAGWSADLKTGQKRNYLEQQACYALGFMDRLFLDEWTVYLIFCDLQTTETLRFTRDEAEKVIKDVKARSLDDLAPATPCDYCGWCARRWQCKTRLESVAWFLGLDPRTVDLSAEMEPEKLGQAMALTYEIAKDDGVHELLKGKAKALFDKGDHVPGWHMQKGRETKSAKALLLQQPFGGKTLLQLCGAQKCMEACGSISAEKFTELWVTAFSGDEIPPGTITVNHGSPFLVKDRKKKEKKEA